MLNTVYENWIKPPKIVKYSNSSLVSYDKEKLVCRFDFPDKYKNNSFYISGCKILDAGQMYWGRRTFYTDRFYSFLEYFSKSNELTAYYFDITLPSVIKKDNVLIVDLKIDFWVLPDKKTYILLDQNEFDEAVESKILYEDEITSCRNTTSLIKKFLDNKQFEKIFTDYEKGKYSDWLRYKEYLQIAS